MYTLGMTVNDMKWRVPIAVLAVLALVACGGEELPREPPQPARPTYDEARRAQWLAGRAGPCRLIIDSVRSQTGGSFVACSEGRTRMEAIACAKEAFEDKQPFLLCNGGWGMDSYIETGVAGLANGNVLFYYLDTFGPRYRGTCLRPNVSFAKDDWPQCRTALVQPIDLKTGDAYVERMGHSSEEKWPRSCAAIAARAPRWPIGVQLVTGETPLPNPERWGLRCKDAVVSFEMIIDRTGRVKCVRILSVGRRTAVQIPGLYDSIRKRLRRWRFKPPTLHGEPVEVRWGMTVNTIRKGESIPGPPIYAACP
jgi:hypothetical protein